MKQLLSVVVVLAMIIASTFMVYAVEPFIIEDGASVAVATVVSVDEETREVLLTNLKQILFNTENYLR